MNIIIYSDFDGTITTYDAFDKIIEDVYSYATYKKLERLTIENKLPYELYLEMFNGIQYDITPLADEVDSTFKEFYEWIQTNHIEFYIVSAGFKTIIKHVLPYVNPDIIYSNDFTYNDDQTWKVKLYDTLSIRKTEIIDLHQKPEYTSIYLGDGLSDFKVIGKVDYLFCKKHSILHKKCILEKHPHHVFNNFEEIKDTIYKLININF
jgi:HAD superfamily phosphoserine phosphatase-like hydrolase